MEALTANLSSSDQRRSDEIVKTTRTEHDEANTNELLDDFMNTVSVVYDSFVD
jgi:hypothetical protein